MIRRAKQIRNRIYKTESVIGRDFMLMKPRYKFRGHNLPATLLVVLLLMAACAPAPTSNSTGTIEDVAATETNAGSAASGEETTIAISGAFALFPIVTVWAEAYQAAHPNVQFDIQAGGAGKGMTDVLAGAVDIAMVSREIREEEANQEAFGVPVTIDAVIGTFNADNPYRDQILAQGITPETGAAIWLTGEISTWGQLLGTEATDAINVYTRSDAAGAAEMWAKYAGGEAQEELRGTAVNADPGLAEAVRQDALGVGYNNIGFAYDPATLEPIAGLQILPLDLDGDGAISEDENFYGTRDELTAAIADGRFPFPPARVLYLVTKGTPSDVIVDFYHYILTDGQALVSDAGYVHLNETQLADALALIEE
jgi:phosphate transport system substrate-binding protein